MSPGTGKEMVDRLTNLVAIFENPALDFSKNRAEGDDTLRDMEAETAALEAKLAKARQLKQGMMQELLTGRIRLV